MIQAQGCYVESRAKGRSQHKKPQQPSLRNGKGDAKNEPEEIPKMLKGHPSQLLMEFPTIWVVPTGTFKCAKREQTELSWYRVNIIRKKFLKAHV